MLPTVAPGQTPGVLRIASSVLHIPSQAAVAHCSGISTALVKGRKAAQERFSEESSRLVNLHLPETHFSNSTVASQISRSSQLTTSLG
jgi:hypothetical protein